MTPRMTFLAAALAAASILMGCSSDDGKPGSGSGSGTGTGTGDGTGNGTGTGTPAGTDTDTGATTPAPSASPATPATPGTPTTATKKAALDACTTNEDCASGVCYIGDQGSYCSLKCTADTAATACVAPFAGTCNKKGFCKKP